MKKYYKYIAIFAGLAILYFGYTKVSGSAPAETGPDTIIVKQDSVNIDTTQKVIDTLTAPKH